MPDVGGRPNLAPGDSNEWVRELQERLQALNLYNGDGAGSYDELTEAGVREMQERYRSHNVDGQVDEETWLALMAMEQDAGIVQPYDGVVPQFDEVTDGQLSEDRAWIWQNGEWQPAADLPNAAPEVDGVASDHQVSEDGHWRWVDNQWQPNA
jgi:hypothetical protein